MMRFILLLDFFFHFRPERFDPVLHHRISRWALIIEYSKIGCDQGGLSPKRIDFIVGEG
jgi:hypothetical protein